MARRKTDVIQFKIRMLEELRKRLEISARDERRSLNAEIVARLEQSYAQPGELTRIREILEFLGKHPELLSTQRQPGPPPRTQAETDHAEQFWARHPQVSPEELSRIQSEALNKAAQEEFDRGHTEVADWLWQQAREAASGRPPRSDAEEREDLRRRLRGARRGPDSPPDQEPELPMPRRESSK